MSRTDVHAPFAVRLLRGEVAHHAEHRCTGEPERCTIPDLEAGWTTGPGACLWQWWFTGHNWCSCWMCHWAHRAEGRRNGRASRRTQLRLVARAYNGGDVEAGCEL